MKLPSEPSLDEGLRGDHHRLLGISTGMGDRKNRKRNRLFWGSRTHIIFMVSQLNIKCLVGWGGGGYRQGKYTTGKATLKEGTVRPQIGPRETRGKGWTIR